MIDLSRRGRIAIVTLARPPVNAIDDRLITAFHSTLDELGADGEWQVLHIRSAQKVFAAGADLELLRSWKDAPSPGRALASYVERLQGLYQRIEQLPQVTFCEIAGAAMGGGYELALACDLRLAADEAKIGLPEVGIGLIPGAGGTQRLTRLCGHGVASRVILGCEPVDGRTAATLGMVQWSVPRAEIEAKARSITDRIAVLPAHALRVAKQCIAAFGGTELHGYNLERELGGALLDSSQTQNLIAAFLDRNSSR
jgi:enoyl-CoA hydratase/carnithine racemase